MYKSKENRVTLLENLYNKWTKDQGVDVKEKWKECLSLTYNLTTNENLCLIQFKVMTRVYYTRDKICKFDNTSSDECLKCNLYGDSLITPLGTAKVLRRFGRAERRLCKYTHRKMIFSPRKCKT